MLKKGGIVFGTDPKAAAAVTESVRKHTKKAGYCKAVAECNGYYGYGEGR